MAALRATGALTAYETIRHVPALVPLIGDYDAQRRGFSWPLARSWLDGLPDGGLNIAHEAVDRHVAAGRGSHVAFRFLSRGSACHELTYSELGTRTDVFAAALQELGVGAGDRVCTLLDRSEELYVTALGP